MSLIFYGLYLTLVFVLYTLNDGFEVKFLRRAKQDQEKFVYPKEDDVSMVKTCEILFVLPDPLTANKITERQKLTVSFPISFAGICENLK